MHIYRNNDVSLISTPPATGAPPAPGLEPLGARLAAIMLNIVTIVIQTYCLTKRWPGWGKRRTLQLFSWLNLFLYVGSLLFASSQMVVRYAFDMNAAMPLCHAAVYICLTFYVWTKLAIYFYFTERSFLVWSKRNSTRATNKLYVFNMVVICGGYIVVVVLTYLYHISYLSQSGFCVIGIHQKISFALATYEVAINVYLTSLFLYPLRNIYSYKTHTSPQLRQMTTRCVIGTLGTLASTGTNLFAISALDGEPAWLCLMVCNLDLLLCVMIVHYVTSFRADKELGSTPDSGLPKAAHGSTVTTSIVHDEQARVNDPRGITVKVEQMQQFDDRPAALDAESGAEKGGTGPPEESDKGLYYPGPAATQRIAVRGDASTSNQSVANGPAETRQGEPARLETSSRRSKFFSRIRWYLQ